MIINDLLKKFDAKFTIKENGEINEINDNILNNSEIIKNNSDEFVLHNKDDDGELFELIVKPIDTVIYNYYDPDGELYSVHSFSDEGIELSN